jgi:hypothetical protein
VSKAPFGSGIQAAKDMQAGRIDLDQILTGFDKRLGALEQAADIAVPIDANARAAETARRAQWERDKVGKPLNPVADKEEADRRYAFDNQASLSMADMSDLITQLVAWVNSNSGQSIMSKSQIAAIAAEGNENLPIIDSKAAYDSLPLGAKFVDQFGRVSVKS